ncbi:Holliday junction recognition protein isoform X2 [Castor canadensis]|uniref:Holliday junction recognition protein isoform X2 n=1 Tax=Castor canadensis TaxID=51338 RepID=A0AC58MFG0_CASCN
MEDKGLKEDELLRKLKNSRSRFQIRMQQLIEKYNQPFEDDPLVQMATLTYETPQGLRIWGGKLIKERRKGQIQDPLVNEVDRTDGPVQAEAKDSESSDAKAPLDQEDPFACALMPAVPWSPLKDELRRKYLTQVDLLLQDASVFEDADKGSGKDTAMTLVPSLASPAVPAPGHCGNISTMNPGDPAKPVSSPREWDPSSPCPTSMAVASGNDSLSLLETSSNSCLSSQTLEASDICNVTISDLYAGMLHSMSRLLSMKPSSIISTKTFIVQNWNPRRRLLHRGKVCLNETYCQRARRSQRSSKERAVPCPKPREKSGTLRDCRNLLHVTRHRTGLKLEKAFLEGNKPQIQKLDPSCKMLQMTPQKRSSLTYLNFNSVHRFDQENRLMALKWLISPVKMFSKPRMLQGPAENRYKEIESKFDKLHQECCPYPRQQQPHLTCPPNSWAMDVYRGGSLSPGSPQGLETYRLSLPFSCSKAKSLSEAFENLGKRSVEEGSFLPKSGLSPLISKGLPSQSPGHSQQTFRKTVPPRKAISVPRTGPLGDERNRYDKIEEEFDRLHQKCCQTSPRQPKVPLQVGVSPGKASAEVQCQARDSLGNFRLDSCSQSFQKLKPSPQGYTGSPRGLPTSEAPLSACTAWASTTRDPQVPAKRRRLSYPQVCERHADSQDSSGSRDKTVPRPGE